MTTREKMVKFRTDHNLSILDMARRCRISSYLMEILEEGAVTTPKLVPQIAEAYGLDELEAEELMPEHLRPHGDDYEPNRYVLDVPVSSRVINKLPDFLWMSLTSRSGHVSHPRCTDEEAIVPNKRRDI